MAGENFERMEQAKAANTPAEDIFQQIVAQVWAAPGAYRHFKAPEIDRTTIDFREDGKVLYTNADGRITRVEDPNGTSHDYSYDKKGNLTVAKITGKDGDSDYWVKEGDGKWRSYDEYHGPGDKRNKFGHLRLSGGNWELNEDGRMYHSSGAVEPVAERPRKR